MQLTVRVLAGPATWISRGELDLLVGQKPVLTREFRHDSLPAGRCTVRAARFDEAGRDLLLDIELVPDVARDMLAPGEEPPVGVVGTFPSAGVPSDGVLRLLALIPRAPATERQGNGGAGPYSIGSDHWPGVGKLIEETGELLQVLGKLIATNGDPAHWDGTDLYDRLVEEMGDVQGALEFLVSQNLTPAYEHAVHARATLKRRRYGKWHREQKIGK